MREKTYKKIEDVIKKPWCNRIKLWKQRYDDYFLFDVMHVGVKGWMEVEKELKNLQTKLTNTHRLILWTLFFLYGYLEHRDLLFCDRFSNIQNLSIVNSKIVYKKGPGTRHS